MRAGGLRDYLTFEDLRPETDTDGNVILDSDGLATETWVDAFEVNTRMPVVLTPLSGRELIAAQSVQSKVTHRVVVRYRPGFNARFRARGGGLIYNIEAVINDPNSGIEYLTLLCSTGVDQGGTA